MKLQDSQRLTPERLAEVRAAEIPDVHIRGFVQSLLAELDAVTAERDEATRMLSTSTVRLGILAHRMEACEADHPDTHRVSLLEAPAWIEEQNQMLQRTRSSDSAASNEGVKREVLCSQLISLGVFCDHAKGHPGPCENSHV